MINKYNNNSFADPRGFPFETALPPGSLNLNTNYAPVSQNTHTVIYVPYFPPRKKEVYPYPGPVTEKNDEKDATDLKYWKDKRQEYSKFLNNI